MATHNVPSYLIKPHHPITVNLIGLGGTGSQLLTKLAQIDHALRAGGLGLGAHPGLQVRAFDGDDVTASNIGRQGFFPQDVGQNKAVVLISRINRAFGLGWEAIPTMYTPALQLQPNMITHANLIISCVDSAKARIEIAGMQGNKVNGEVNAFEREYYWLDLGNAKNVGQAVLGTLNRIEQPKGLKDTVDRLPSILQMFPDLQAHDNEEEQGASCSVAQSLNSQDLCVNSMLAEWGKKLIWNLFRKMRLDTHGVFVNLDNMIVNPIPVKTNDTKRTVNHTQKRRAKSRPSVRKNTQVRKRKTKGGKLSRKESKVVHKPKKRRNL